MNRSKTPLLRLMGVALPLLLLNSIALGQTKEIEITVDNPRPMEAAVMKIEELSGIPINYEEVPIYYVADLKDVTAEVRTTPPAGVRLLVPLGGQLSVSIAVDAATGKLNDVQSVKDALSAVISAYNSSGLPGGYDFEEYKGVFFVKPVRYRDASGATQTMRPLLSTPITFPEEKREWSLTLGLILQQLSKAAGSRIGGYVDPIGGYVGLGMPEPVTFGADNEAAGHAIVRFIAADMCVNRRTAAACAPANRTSETAWDVGYHYHLRYAQRLGYEPIRWGYSFRIDRVPNSRWFVPPPPSKPYSPPTPRPRSEGLGTGAFEAR